MNSISNIITKTPFAGLLIAIIIGIFIGSHFQTLYLPALFFAFTIAILIFSNRFSKSPLHSYKIKNLHFLWLIFAFIGIGNLSATLQYPKHINLSDLQNFGFGEVISIRHKTTGEQLIVKVNKHSNTINSLTDCENFNLLLMTNGYNVNEGDVIRFPLTIEEIRNNENQEGFDYVKYMIYQGIRYKSYATADEIKTISHNISLNSITIKTRNNLIETIEKTSINKETQNFLITILLGDKDYINSETREAFADAGIAHILALSGLHTGVIALLISFLLIPLNFFKKQKIKYCLIIISIWIFAFITGMSPSVMRASVMISFYYLALILERKNNSINALCGAGILILTISPFALYDLGTQLSFTTVISILIFADKINFINRRIHKYTYNIVSIIIISIIATISSWALTAFYFHKISLLFLPLNIIVIPLMPIYLAIVILYILLFSFGVEIDIFVSIINFSYDVLMNSAQYISNLQFSTIEIWLSEWSVTLYYISLIVLATAIHKKSRYTLIVSINLLLITIISVMVLPNSKPSDGFIVQNNWDNSYIRIYKDGNDFLVTLQQDTTSCYLIHNKKIIFVDNNRISLIETRRDRLYAIGDTININLKPLNCDYLLLGDGYRGKIQHLLRHYNPDLLVVMPEVYKSKQIALKQEATKINYPIFLFSKNSTLKYLINK